MKNQPLNYPAFKITNKNAAGIVFDLAWTETQAAPRLAHWNSRAPGFVIEPNKPDQEGDAVYPEGKKSEVAADLSGPWQVNDLITCKHSGAVARVAELKVNGADVEIQDGTNARSFVPEANFIDFDLLQRGAPASSNAEPAAGGGTDSPESGTKGSENGTPAPESETAPRRRHAPRKAGDLARRKPAAPVKHAAASKPAGKKPAHKPAAKKSAAKKK